MRPHINASINAIMEHALAHLGSEVQRIASTWSGAMVAAKSGDELKAAVARVDDEWPAALTRIVGEVRLLTIGGVGGAARDLQADVVAPLRAHGVEDHRLRPPKSAPIVPPVELLPNVAGAGSSKLGGASWLAGLFRSLDTRRTDVLDRLQQRVTRIGEVARAEMFDAEPRLHAALAGVLAAAVDDVLHGQIRWLDDKFARERESIDRDRLQQAPLVALRDAAREDVRRLTELTAAVELGE